MNATILDPSAAASVVSRLTREQSDKISVWAAKYGGDTESTTVRDYGRGDYTVGVYSKCGRHGHVAYVPRII